MKQFLLGFGVASFAWCGVLLYAQSTGMLNLFGSEDEAVPDGADTDVVELSSKKIEKTPKKKRRGKRRHRSRTGLPMGDIEWDTSVGLAGDALGQPGARELAMGQGGAEDQLSEAEIDRGIDRVFKGIQRCLVLLPAGAPATGKVVFGMHIASSGKVTKVNLKGPNTMIRGESGACFRRTVKSIRYRSFDGPDMITHYPIVFE